MISQVCEIWFNNLKCWIWFNIIVKSLHLNISWPCNDILPICHHKYWIKLKTIVWPKGPIGPKPPGGLSREGANWLIGNVMSEGTDTQLKESSGSKSYQAQLKKVLTVIQFVSGFPTHSDSSIVKVTNLQTSWKIDFCMNGSTSGQNYCTLGAALRWASRPRVKHFLLTY